MKVLSVNSFWQILDTVEKTRLGQLQGSQCRKKLTRLFGSQLRTSLGRTFERIFCALDADVRQNRLAVVDDSFIGIYDVTPPTGTDDVLHKCLYSLPTPLTGRLSVEFSLSVIRWSPEGSLFTTSGTSIDRNAFTVHDASTSGIVETIKLNVYGSKAAYAHEHSSVEPALVAIGTSVNQVFIADLRTGNVALSSSAQHKNGIHSLCWSVSDENLLITASVDEILVWDKRYISKTSAVQFYYDHSFNVSPDVKFVDTNNVAVMNCRKNIYIHNVYTGNVHRTIDTGRYREYDGTWPRYKFAVNREARIIYFPIKRGIRAIDLSSNRVVIETDGGHIFPIDKLLFNDYYKELYSINRKYESLIWTPFSMKTNAFA